MDDAYRLIDAIPQIRTTRLAFPFRAYYALIQPRCEMIVVMPHPSDYGYESVGVRANRFSCRPRVYVS